MGVFFLLEFITFWGTALVGLIATLVTVCISKDQKVRNAAVFNAVSFAVATLVLHFGIKAIHPGYRYFYKLQDSWIPFSGFYILLYFLFADFLFYLYHRMTHSVPFLWLGHFSHHSGNQLHLSLIIRDSVLSHIFMLPIGLLGIPLGLSPVGLFSFIRIILFYQAFLHYYTNQDRPILKYFLVTPYNHILHHSDVFSGAGHNFGGILNIWDRLCGTYQENPALLKGFGMPELKNPNSLWTNNVYPLLELSKECWTQRSIKPFFLFAQLSYDLRNSLVTSGFYIFCLFLVLDIVRRAI